MLLRRSFVLFLLLVITGTSSGREGPSGKDHGKRHPESKQANVPFAPSSTSSSSSSSAHQLTSRKISDPNNISAHNRQGLAGPLLLGLSSLLLPALPMLLLAPIAVAGLGPAVNYVSDALGSNSNSNAAGSATNSDRDSALSHVLHSLAQSNSGISSALQSLAQKGSSSGSSGSQSLQSSSSNNAPVLASPAASTSSSSPSGSISSQVAQALGLSENSLVSSGDSSSILSGITNFLGPDRNSPAGSSSLSQILSLSSGGNRPSLFSSLTGKKPSSSNSNGPSVSSSSSSSSSQSMPDYFGAAAAALDNAGLLGPISGAGSGSVTDKLFSLMSGSTSHKNSGSSASGSGGAGSSSLSSLSGNSGSISSSLADLLGLGSSSSSASLAPAPASSSSSSASSSSSLLGSSLSSNIIHNLPQAYGNALAGIKTPIKHSSTSLSSSSSSPAGSSSGSSIQSLANNALNKISSFIFSRRRSEWIPRPYPGFGYLDNANTLIDNTSAKVRSGFASYLRDAYSTLKDGIRKYEVAEPECQARLMCELHQKSVGRSFKSVANTLFDVLGVEKFLDSTPAFNARAKSVMKDMYHAAKNGMSESDCAEIYSKCPVSISVEPLRNSLFNKLVRGSGHNILTQYAPQHQQIDMQSHMKEDTIAHVYGPSATGMQMQQQQEQRQEPVQVQQPVKQKPQQHIQTGKPERKLNHVTKSSLTTPSALSILPPPILSKPGSTGSSSSVSIISQPDNAVGSKQQSNDQIRRRKRRSIRV